MVGLPDGHTALSTGEENNFFGTLFNAEPAAGASMLLQERAYTSPFWYQPAEN